jgi:hypothetical protein
MRIGLTVVCILMPWNTATCLAEEPPSPVRKTEPIGAALWAALREASEIASKQDEHQNYWTDRVLLRIGRVQTRAGDFDGALRTICQCSDRSGRNVGLGRVAEEVARRGDRERAFDILQLRDWRNDYYEDAVPLRWIEHLIAAGDLDGACNAIEQLKSDRFRPDALRKLAVAYAKVDNACRATEQFRLTLDAAAALEDDRDRARAFWETAEAQLTVGELGAAKETIRRLVETLELRDAWAKFSALKEGATLAARMGDNETAHHFFRQALDAQKAIDNLNKPNALRELAVALAGVGYVNEARTTVWMTKKDTKDLDLEGEEALCAVAVAQEKCNDTLGAVDTAMSIRRCLQLRDDALHKIIDCQIAKHNLVSALTITDKIPNPSRKAAAILKVATAYAKSGDRKTAAAVAARIELTQRDGDRRQGNRFDYRLPQSWGVSYDAGRAFTMTSARLATQRAEEVAVAAMGLAQALGQRPTQSYAVLFNDISVEEVTLALARTHAFLGDPSDALTWARQIGSSDKVKPKDDRHTCWAVERRIYALIGVAEGILDRSREGLGQPVQ